MTAITPPVQAPPLSPLEEAEGALARARGVLFDPTAATPSVLLAVALYLRAAILESRHVATEEAAPPAWARVELFGHQVRYGTVVEVEFAGRRFVEVTEPAISCLAEKDGELVEHGVSEERRKRYHPNAIYAIEELPGEQVRGMLYSTRGLFQHEDGSWRERPGRYVGEDDEGDDLF